MYELVSKAGGLVTAAALVWVAGCAGPSLPPSPTLFTQTEGLTLGVAPAQQSVEMQIMYVTDRRPKEGAEAPHMGYGDGRSSSLAVGRATVSLGKDMSWEDLQAQSMTDDAPSIQQRITSTEEVVRLPSSLHIPIWLDGRLVEDPDAVAIRAEAEEAVRAEIRRRLENVERKELFVYVHGVGNSFGGPIHRLASLWHYMGRPGVPVAYAWPSRSGGGALRMYTYARESSEFTVYHLRSFLEIAAACSEVERIHLIAHSRGTGIVLDVLHQLRLIHHDDPDAGRRATKLGNIVMAAPDIDLEVGNQIYYPDRVYQIYDRLTMYMTDADEALGLSNTLFAGSARVGSTSLADLPPEERVAVREQRAGHDAVEVNVRDRGGFSHGYWIESPAVLSDIILILRDDRSPGREHGRPLLFNPSGFWEIRDGYPNEGAHAGE
ncbi:MAG: alpha/beta hydrolase [Planctomycetota bacterium]